MILCGVTSFSLLYADNLRECQDEEDMKTGCIIKAYYENGNLASEIPLKMG